MMIFNNNFNVYLSCFLILIHMIVDYINIKKRQFHIHDFVFIVRLFIVRV